MKSRKTILFTLVLTLSVIFSACATKVQAPQQPYEKPQQVVDPTPVVGQQQPNESTEQPAFVQGSQKMKDVLKEMKEAIAAKDYDKAIKTSEGLEENWAPIEDTIKDKSKDIYDKVEEPLDMIRAAVKVSPFDEKTIVSEIDKLDNVLSEVMQIK